MYHKPLVLFASITRWQLYYVAIAGTGAISLRLPDAKADKKASFVYFIQI